LKQERGISFSGGKTLEEKEKTLSDAEALARRAIGRLTQREEFRGKMKKGLVDPRKKGKSMKRYARRRVKGLRKLGPV